MSSLRLHTPADHLRLARAENDAAVLHLLVQSPYSFVWQALAANPHTPPGALRELSTARDSDWNDNALLRLLATHPRADRTVLCAVLDMTATKLIEGSRPYAAAVALADRRELDVEEVRQLGALRGASARLRGLLARRLNARV